MALGVIEGYADQVKRGALDEDEAKARALATLSTMQANKGVDYFFVTDEVPTMLMHPTRPDLIGKPLDDVLSPDGKRIFPEFVRVAQAGGGHVDYSWAKAGEEDPVPKTSYAVLYQPWGWVIGTGVYVDDTQAQALQFTFIMTVAGGLLVLLSMAIGWVIGQSVLEPVSRALAAIKGVSRGDLSVRTGHHGRLRGAEGKDPAGRLIMDPRKAYFHLPGLFEFYELYRMFLPLYREHREYFYDWCEIGSVYGAPADCIWGGGRAGFGENDPEEVLELMQEYGISARLTFSNSLLRQEHLSDRKCNALCRLFERNREPQNGVIIYSELLLEYIKEQYPGLYFVSSTTKVLTDFTQLEEEIRRKDFHYVVPDFRLNKAFDKLNTLSQAEKDKVEFLCNECCWFGCRDRKACYETVSRKNLGENCPEHYCKAPEGERGYLFSKAIENPGFIGINDIRDIYLPMGFSNFKIEGRGLGSALILEFLLYYMTRPEYQIHVREKIYLDSMLDLF